MKEELLKKFLVSLPKKLQYDKISHIKSNLFKGLYYAVTNEGEFMHELFPNISDMEMMDLHDYDFKLNLMEDDEAIHFFDQPSSQGYTHPKGTACARPLQKGEPVYRCDDCGFDSTCVLCVYCFNENDHVGHNVQMYIARDSTNGICDCGDPEAFVDDLKCKCQLIESSTTEINPAFKSSITLTLKILLDYILDVTNFSISTLPFIHDHINKGHSILTSEALSDFASLSFDKYGVEDVNTNHWYLVLWNDEHHNFPEATNAISAAIRVEHIKAHEIASEVNINGRCILKTADSPIALYKALDTVESGGLVASIMSSRDYCREEIIDNIFEWIQDILSFDDSSFRECARLVLGELLLEPNYSFIKTLPNALIEGLSIDIQRRCFENSLLYGGQLVNGGLTQVKSNFTIKDLNKSSHLILEKSFEPFQNSRLQFLLAFSIRFKSSIRKKLSQILIPPVLTDTTMKAIFCKQYIQMYPQLITSLALVDREEHLNCIADISSQLMTCPTSVKYILESGHIGYVIGPLAQLIEEHAGKWNYDTGYPNFHEPLTNEPMRSKSLYEAITRSLHDINYIVDSNLGSPSLHVLLSRSNLALVLLLLRNFQGYWTIERKYGEHVERELLDFVIHLRYSVPILKISKQVAEAETDNMEMIKEASKLIIDYLNLRKIDQKAPGISDYTVSKDPVSFVHPINSLLSYLLQNNDFSNFIDILKNLNSPFMKISDVSLRSIVLGNQVKVGFWIRNGMSVSRQASLYIDSVMSDSAYWRDIHLNQVAILFDDVKSTLYNFLDRWELLYWFTGEVTYNDTIYEDRFPAISEKFILFVFNLISDRTSFIKLSKPDRLSIIARKLISYSLSEGPKSYSNIKDMIDVEISSHSDFDKWLLEVADYQSPTSLVDSGMYRLKTHIYGELDPYSIHLDSSQSSDVSESIVKYMAKAKKIPENEVNLIPKIILSDNEFVNANIGNFTRTTFFAKLIYKFLQVSLDTKDETYLPHLLHLLHAIILDYELINKSPKSIPDSLVTIPIADLLLNIIESTMSKPLVNKAYFLIDLFITRDERVVESLMDCFGKVHITEFLKKRTGNFESESEKRKRIASERNAKVLKKFAKQRKKFLDKNEDLRVETNDNKVEIHHHIEKRNCVLCGESENGDEIFGILGSALNTSILWKVTNDDPTIFKSAFAKYGDEIYQEGVYGKGYKYSTKQNNFNNLKYDAFVASTCSHGMHYNCYRRACGRSNHFSCPLCHSIQNIFIPSFLPPLEGGGLTEPQLDFDPVNTRYNQISHSSSELKSRMMIDALFNENLTESSMIQLRRNLDVFSDDFNLKLRKGDFLDGDSKSIKYFNVLSKLSTLIADTIRMHEITSRLEGNESYYNFLNMSGSSKTLIKSLIQCRVLLFELREMPSLLGSTNNFATEIENFWESNYLVDGVFNEVIMLFFQTDESLKSLARLGFTKIVTICFYSLVIRCRDNFYIGLITDVVENKPLDEKILLDLDKIFNHGKDTFNIDYVNEGDKVSYYTNIYYAVERCILPFLRQLIIFKDILTSTNDGDNTHTSIPELQQLEFEIKGQERWDCSDVLCKKLGLPTLQELIHGLNSDSLPFEYKVHDIVLQAKIPKYLDAGVLTIDYPGVIKLINLPKDYMTCLMDYNERTRSGIYDNYICLHCGIKFPAGKYYRHMKRCSNHTCIFFHPSKNNFRVVTHIGGGPISLLMPGPYLTIHGEVKEPRTSGKATLNDFRYHDLNKSYLNQGLYSFITRTLYGSRQNNGAPMNNFNFTTPTTLGEESSDEEDDDYFYSPFAW